MWLWWRPPREAVEEAILGAPTEVAAEVAVGPSVMTLQCGR